MNKYFITLRPVEDYFFGGENTFRNNDSDETNYFARSNPWPQQTTLLGLLRYLLLKSNDALPLQSNKSKADSLIGKESFKPDIKEQEQNFGVIHKISPLYIFNEKDKVIYRISLPFENFEVSFNNNGKILLAGTKNFTVSINGYDPKKHYKPVLKDNTGNTIDFDEVFVELHPKTGIEKERLQNDENKLYKQIFYTLKEPYSFAFYAGLEDKYSFDGKENTTILEKSGNIFFGGEQKYFVFHTYKEDNKGFVKEPDFNQNDFSSIVLLSDAMVDNSIFSNAKFIINQVQDFRTVRMAFGNRKFNKRNDVSIKINLLKRGSVIFFEDDVKEITTLLEKYKNYRKTGFNQYIIK